MDESQTDLIRGSLPEIAMSKSVTQAEMAYLAKLIEEYERRIEKSGNAKRFIPGSPYAIENCPKHKLFFDLGSQYRVRMLRAANRVGKTEAGAFELACHLTGEYPDWWEGKRFDKPVIAWACGQTRDETRDAPQKALMGPPGAIGTGALAADKIEKVWSSRGIPNGIDTVRVKHISGGSSIVGFKTYEQGVESFYGTAMDVIWMDEEPPHIIYNECLIRTMTTEGIIYVTFTPLAGLTSFTIDFDKASDHAGGADRVVALTDEEQTKWDRKKHKPMSVVVSAGWNDAPWITDKAKDEMLSGTPPHLRATRSTGVVALGAGNIYPIPLEELLVEPFQIPMHYKRIYGFDVGYNRTAALMLALDPDSDVVYAYQEYYRGEADAQVHATRIKELALGWIPGVIDPASRGRSQRGGEQLFAVYKQLGLKLKIADNAVDAGIDRVWMRLAAGKLKFFSNLHNLRKEYLIYRRDLNGKIVKEDDHLMDALRYGVGAIDLARSQRSPDDPMEVVPFGRLGGPQPVTGGKGGRVYRW